MGKISKAVVATLVFLSLINIANAFGYMGDKDIYDLMGMSGFGMVMGLGVAAILIGVLLFVFWLLMLVDCLKRDFKKDYEKIVWVLVMIFLHLLGAVIYYFVVKAGEKKINVIRKK